MTRDRLSYVLLLAGIAILHIMLVDYISYFILIFFILLPCISLFITGAFCRDSVVGMKIGAAVAAKGDPLIIELSVKNTSLLPVRTRVELVLRNELTGDEEREVFVLTGGRRGREVTQSVSFARAGRIRLSIEKAGVYDLLGLVCLRTKRACRMSVGLLVAPDVVALSGRGVGGGAGRDIENDGLMQVVKGDDPSELYDIREYQPGDRVTRIHWKLSERTGRLMVKELGRVLAGDALLMLDLNGGAEEADALLTAFASLSASLVKDGVSHDVAWYGVRRDSMEKDHIASEADRERVVASILGGGGLTDEPLVMKGRQQSGVRNPYARVFYLCAQAGVDDDDLTAFIAKMAAPEMSIVMVRRDALADTETAAPPAANLFPRILRTSPQGIAAALEETVA
jgi:uncharacterized protein (DUF58 family)